MNLIFRHEYLTFICNFVPVLKICSMANEKILIAGIEYKVRKLIETNVLLKKENTRLLDENGEKAKKIEELNKKIEENQKEIFKFTLANTLETELGVEEGKKRIDSLIGEIDKCIMVLSE